MNEAIFTCEAEADPELYFESMWDIDEPVLKAVGGPKPMLWRPDVTPTHLGHVGTRIDPMELSTRKPSIAENAGVGVHHLLLSTHDNYRLAPEKDRLAVQTMQGYANHPVIPGEDHEETKHHIINHMKNNLLFLHDQVPDAIAEHSKRWYDGANKMAQALAQKHGKAIHQAAGVIAALSPQTDWYKNASQAARVMHAHEHLGDHEWTPQMEATSRRIFKNPKLDPIIDDIRGKRFSDVGQTGNHGVDMMQKALWFRTHDVTHGPKTYDQVSPEGDSLGTMMTGKGTPEKFHWLDNNPIAKAFSILHDGSHENLNEQLGDAHKVRNFYNNIAFPNNPNGHATIDTHAVAANLLQPFGGTALPVSHNFGAGAAAAHLGLKGTYPYHLEALTQAARERGRLPREMQSITWEAARGLFPDSWKTEGNKRRIEAIWQGHKDGRYGANDARAKVLEAAGGRVRDPDWTQKVMG